MATLIPWAAEQSTASVAVLDELGTSRSWAELEGRVNQWIRLLRGNGLGTGDRVCVLAGNRAEVVEVLLACLHTGLIAVPVNWHLTAPEIGYLLGDSGARCLVTDPERAATAAAAL